MEYSQTAINSGVTDESLITISSATALHIGAVAFIHRFGSSLNGHDKRGTKVDELHLTPLELIDRIAALVPPPRTHRRTSCGRF